MFSRVNANSDILENGKIMLFVDSEPGCYTLTDLQYLEHALRELLVETYKSIQEAELKKNSLSFERYVEILSSLTNSLKVITESLLRVKKGTKADGDLDGTIIADSFIKEIMEYRVVKSR